MSLRDDGDVTALSMGRIVHGTPSLDHKGPEVASTYGASFTPIAASGTLAFILRPLVVTLRTGDCPFSEARCAARPATRLNADDGLGHGGAAARVPARLSLSSCRLHDLALNFGVFALRPYAGPARSPPCRDRLRNWPPRMGTFLTLAELGLPGEDEIVNRAPPRSGALDELPRVRGITVNTAHGNARSIAVITQRFTPQVESMEGAAFMYACLINEVPFAQVRAVSNVVERRNRASLKMEDANR